MSEPGRRGTRLGVDLGDVRIGVARSDPDGRFATPVETVAAGETALGRLAALCAEHAVVEVVLGLPLSMSGAEGPAAGRVRSFGARLAAVLAPVPVRLVDERLSTVAAERGLRQGGGTGGPGRAAGRRRRRVVDQAAAVVILQAALDSRRGPGESPGEVVQVATAVPPAEVAPDGNGSAGE